MSLWSIIRISREERAGSQREWALDGDYTANHGTGGLNQMLSQLTPWQQWLVHFHCEWYLLYSQRYFFVIFVYYILINYLSSSQRSRLMSHGVSKTFYVRNVPYYLICTGFCRMNISILCSPPDQIGTFFVSGPLKWEKRAIDTGVGNKKSGPNSHPLLSHHHLCVGFSHSPGILCLRTHGADKGCSVSGVSTALAPSQGSYFVGRRE